MFVILKGAKLDTDGGIPVYRLRGNIFINPERIDCFYDHTIYIREMKISVMETAEEIARKIDRAEALTCT